MVPLLVPPGFLQMLVILFIDEDTNIRYPGLFCLLNNKKYESYLLVFTRIKI